MKSADIDAGFHDSPVGRIVKVRQMSTLSLVRAGYLPCNGSSMREIPDNYTQLKKFLSKVDGKCLPNLA